MQSKFTIRNSSKKKLQSLLLIEPDISVKKGIAVTLMDYFEEIQMTNNIIEAIKILNEQNFSVIIIDEDLLNQVSNTENFLSSAAQSVLMILGAPPDGNIELKFHKNYMIYEKPLDIKQILIDVNGLLNK